MKIATGIRQTASGYEAYVRVHGRLRTKRFKPGTKPVEMIRWRELQRVTAHYHIETPFAAGRRTFADDVADYLQLVAGMPTYSDRKYRIEQWANLFGPRDRHAITALEIRQQLETWRINGRVDGKALSPASLNQRRTALMHFYTTLSGKAGANPVKDVPPYREEELLLRLPTYEEAERAIAAANHPKYPKKEGTKSQARLRVLLYTGWPSAVLKTLKSEHIDWTHSRVLLVGRRKGKGTKPVQLPVSTAALAALRQFDKVKGYGPFSGSSLHSALQRGCKRAKVKPFRVYDLRHRFATSIVAASADERGAAELLMSHQIRRYSRHAASERATAALQAAFPPTLPTPQGRSRGVTGTRRRKKQTREKAGNP